MDAFKEDYVIALNDVPVIMRVGLCDWEKLTPTRVLISVTMTGAPECDRKTLETCIDYSLVYDFLQTDIANGPHTDLIETVAARILDFCFSTFSLSSCAVTVQKPDVFGGRGAPCVTLTRSRA